MNYYLYNGENTEEITKEEYQELIQPILTQETPEIDFESAEVREILDTIENIDTLSEEEIIEILKGEIYNEI